jgi:hypothetical protein
MNMQSYWMLWDTLLSKAKVAVPGYEGPGFGKCPLASKPGSRYLENNMYSPPSTSWLWHPPPYKAFPGNTWVEVMHHKDPFGDEHHGLWFLYAKGSGIWFNTGKTISFGVHEEAFHYFGASGNEPMCQMAASQGYDSIQFVSWHDCTNYPCRTENCLMNIEIVATKLVGTYSCGSAGAAPQSLRGGWHSKPCSCTNQEDTINCGEHQALRGVFKWPQNGTEADYFMLPSNVDIIVEV